MANDGPFEDITEILERIARKIVNDRLSLSTRDALSIRKAIVGIHSLRIMLNTANSFQPLRKSRPRVKGRSIG